MSRHPGYPATWPTVPIAAVTEPIPVVVPPTMPLPATPRRRSRLLRTAELAPLTIPFLAGAWAALETCVHAIGGIP